MSRPLRIEFEGAVYHVTSRGNARQRIFADRADKEKFLEILAFVVERFGWLCHAYCLMDNHYHLLIETPEGNLSGAMRQLNGMYTQRFNRRHARVGHLFQGRYKAILVEKDSHLLSLCRYVVLNPVRAGLAKGPGGWKWSSYRATIRSGAVPEFLTVDWVLSQFASDRKQARKQYRKFIFAGRDGGSPWADLKGQILLGTAGFVEKFRGLLGESEGLREIPRAQRYAARPPLDVLLAADAVKERKARDEAVYAAHISYCYTLREIGDHLGVHYSTISRAIRRAEEKRMRQCKT